VRLGVDPKHADQMVRGAVVLPHGIGKNVRVAVFAKGEKEREAREAGADVVGAEDLVERVQGGGLPERKAGSKMLARAQIEALRKALGECPDADEVAPDDLLRFVLGERDVLHGYACVHRALQEAGVIMRPRGAA